MSYNPITAQSNANFSVSSLCLIRLNAGSASPGELKNERNQNLLRRKEVTQINKAGTRCRRLQKHLSTSLSLTPQVLEWELLNVWMSASSSAINHAQLKPKSRVSYTFD